MAWVMMANAAHAQQISGVPGSPGATMTLDGKQLPPPPLPFGGVIKQSYLDSKPYTGRRGLCRPAHPSFFSS
jgi:arylsulfatase